jgi:hypothetical protein
MTFVLLKNYHHYVIVNDDADVIASRVYPLGGQQGPYRVTSDIGRSDQCNAIGVVKSLDDAIPTFIDYCKKNPVPWERRSAALYWRYTLFVSLRVEQDQRGHWQAYRDDYPLLADTKPARFVTFADAQRTADAHELDLFRTPR